jgi:hypothetical protein
MDAIPEFTRDLLVSLHPRHASNILSGEKTVELLRRFPEQHTTRGALALMYSTPVQAIVGVARIKHVLKLPRAYLIGRREYDFWSAHDDEEQQAMLGDSVKPIFDAGLVQLVELDHVISPEIRLTV